MEINIHPTTTAFHIQSHSLPLLYPFIISTEVDAQPGIKFLLESLLIKLYSIPSLLPPTLWH